eukprot:COSAG02_NODE_339_length_24201_cov_45.538462_8_plen_511_part_00
MLAGCSSKQCLAALVCLGAAFTSGEVIDGHAASREGWAFLGKFVFGVTDPSKSVTHPGPIECGAQGPDAREEWMQTVSVRLRAPHPRHAAPGLRIYLYDDQEMSWPYVYDAGHPRHDLSCHERSEFFRYSTVHGGHLRGVLPCDGSFPVIWDAEREFTFTRAIVQRLRPRTWYVVLASQNCSAVLGVHFSLEFLNAADDQFGTDEDGLLPLYLCFTVAFGGLLAMQWRSRTLWARHTKHLKGHLPRLLQFSVSCACLGAGLHSAHYLLFHFDGGGFPMLRFTAGCVQAASKLVFVMVLLLLAQGWTIVRAEVQHRALLVGLMQALVLSTFALLCWGSWPATAKQEVADGMAAWLKRDPASSRYLYDETPGKMLLLLDAAVALAFLGCAYRTLESTDFGQHRLRLMRFCAAIFGAYILLMPFIVVVAAGSIDPWSRQFWTRALEQISIFGSNAALCWAIWPTRAEKYFLYFGNFSSASSLGSVGRVDGRAFEQLEQQQLNLVSVEASVASV